VVPIVEIIVNQATSGTSPLSELLAKVEHPIPLDFDIVLGMEVTNEVVAGFELLLVGDFPQLIEATIGMEALGDDAHLDQIAILHILEDVQ